MRKLIVDEWMTLDGVVQSPSSPDEDSEGGFSHGGWHMPYMDDVAMKWTLENVTSAGGFVLGRRTYEIFAAHWPNAGEEEQSFAKPLNTQPKYVASTTLSDPLEWQNSTVLQGDLAEAVKSLKEEDGDDLHVLGSTRVVATLTAHELVDEFRLMIDPVFVGDGKRLFPDPAKITPLQLVGTEATSTGAVLATYAPKLGRPSRNQRQAQPSD
jgi:dihydrofolate reductase